VRFENLGEFKVVSLRETPPELLSYIVDTPEKAREYWQAHVASDPRFNPDVECLVCLVLNTRRRVMGHFLVSTGTMDTILVHPREVFRGAIIAGAAALVVMHNHPSGDPTPSEADIKVTRDLIRGGQLLKIEVLDHVIVGSMPLPDSKGYVSLRELGYFYS
jgi:DNA repair protein RadC